jgi:hypothetical protein
MAAAGSSHNLSDSNLKLKRFFQLVFPSQVKSADLDAADWDTYLQTKTTHSYLTDAAVPEDATEKNICSWFDEMLSLFEHVCLSVQPDGGDLIMKKNILDLIGHLSGLVEMLSGPDLALGGRDLYVILLELIRKTTTTIVKPDDDTSMCIKIGGMF